MRVHIKAALTLGVAASLFSGSLLLSYADDSDPAAMDDQATVAVDDQAPATADDQVPATVDDQVPADDQAPVAVDDTPATSADDQATDETTDADSQATTGDAAVDEEEPAIVAVDDEATYAVWPPSQELKINVCDNDTGADLTLSSAGPAQHGTAVVDGSAVLYMPTDGFIGVDTFPYTITDAAGQTATATVTVNVTFTVDDVTATVGEGQPDLVFELTTGDDNYDFTSSQYTIKSVSEPSHGTAHSARLMMGDVQTMVVKAVFYTPDPGFLGTDSFTYTVQDEYANTASALITVTVVTPFAYGDRVNIIVRGQNGVANNVIKVLNGAVGTGLSVQSVAGATHGTTTITDNGQTVTYVPNQGYYGDDTFQFTIVDVNGKTSTASIFLYVMSRLETADDSATTRPNTAVEIPVFANDEGYENVTVYQTYMGPSHGTATPVVCSGSDTEQKLCVLYTPAPGFTGVDTFKYQLTDDTGGISAGATVTVTVAPSVTIPGGGSSLPPSSAPLALMAMGMIVVASAFATRMARR